MTVWPQNSNFNYLIDPTFTNSRHSCSNYYVPKVEINDFEVLIDGKSFFDLSVKTKEEAYKEIMEMSRNNDYTTSNLLDFGYFIKNYRLIAIDLSKQTKLKDPQEINIFGKLTKNTGATIFFIIEKCRRNYF